ncbi:MAG: anhydro-N-acetylmuramic acid kinase [Pseudomonadota bacterium]|nr:anhydro-N-acetylmuramic acid kinase [Pseudomonadota bacterium]
MPGQTKSGGLYIGLMSGTSMDGIDAALVRFGDHECDVLSTFKYDYPDNLRDDLIAASRRPDECTVDLIGHLDHWTGECFRDAALGLIECSNFDTDSIVAIGSHGQTLRHQPRAARPFTFQIGDPNLIALGTGIRTVADFRRRDVADGGEGAPLTPAFHHWLFSDPSKHRAVLNIGGIANVTILNSNSQNMIGFDTGPGNSLLDGWIRGHREQAFDHDGEWASEGFINENLLAHMLAEPYFDQPPPKSTGFEYFNGSWVRARIASLGNEKVSTVDVQATLAELSARTITSSILRFAPDIAEVLVCGGGVHNSNLLDRLRNSLPGVEMSSTEIYGVHPDWIEAVAFAWLAKRRLERKPANIPGVTGSAAAQVLGAIYPGCR